MLVTVSDRKIGVDSNNDGTVDYYTPMVISAHDYYPYGQLEPDRQYDEINGVYRYGFNGKEKDNDINGPYVDYNYGARIYDARIGKFLSVDPLADNYPWNSTYSFAESDPINYIDLDGKEKSKLSDANQAHTAALMLATARGTADAYYNDLLGGVPDLFPIGWGSTDHSGDYSSDPDLQAAYLAGRSGGDALALAQGDAEINTGKGMMAQGGEVALATGIETEGVGAAAGGGEAAAGGTVGIHGVAMKTAALADAVKVAAKLTQINGTPKTTVSNKTDNQTDAAHSNKQAANSNESQTQDKAKVETNQNKNNQGNGQGRGANNRRPDPNATGDHTVSNDRGSTTYQKNEKNPSGFQEVKRTDTKGAAHNGVPTPHVHENGTVRPATPSEIPKTNLNTNQPPNK